MNITNDINKKQLVEKLIKEGKISLDEGLNLLQEGVFIIDLTPAVQPFITPYVQPLTWPSPITYPVCPQYPMIPSDWPFGMIPGDFYTTSIT